MPEKFSRGNFPEEIYSWKEISKSQMGKINRIEYENPGVLTPYFKSHPAYFSDFVAFQHMELWLDGLSLKDGIFSFTESRIPLIISCRLAGNRQKLGPIPFYLGNITYNISDFNTSERISSEETVIKPFMTKGLLKLFADEGINYGNQNSLSISMQNSDKGKSFEVRIADDEKKVYGRLLFKARNNYENGYAESLNSGEEKALREFTSKRWFEFNREESFLGYDGNAIDFSKIDATSFIDEANGFSPKRKNWDWMIFSNNSFGNDIRLILGKKCRRAGFDQEEYGLASFFIDGKLYRIKGRVNFNYDVNDLSKPLEVYIDGGKGNQAEIKTISVAPFVEKSTLDKKISSVKVNLDLQRVIARTMIKGEINGREISTMGIASFESNKGMERGTKYFND